MVDVKKLNSTIKNLENEVDNIRNISEIVSSLEKLNEELSITKKAYKITTNEIKNIKNGMVNAIKTNETFVNEAKEALSIIDKTIDNRVSNIQEENLEFHSELTKDYKKLENDLLSHIQSIRAENNKHYLEVDDMIASKLDGNKSDIRLEIRDNSTEIISEIDNNIEIKI